MCCCPCAVHILPKESYVYCVHDRLVPAWNITYDTIPLIFTTIVLAGILGSIMNVYVNFCLPVNVSGSLMQDEPWVCNISCRFNPSIIHLLNFGIDIISCHWFI